MQYKYRISVVRTGENYGVNEFFEKNTGDRRTKSGGNELVSNLGCSTHLSAIHFIPILMLHT